MEDIEKLKVTFYSEADDILNNLDELLLNLEHDPGNRETIDAVFRNMHTLKGSSGIFEFHSIERLAHACEDLLDFMRTVLALSEAKKEDAGEISSEKMIDTLFVGLDQIKDMLSHIQAGQGTTGIAYEDTVKNIRALLPEKDHQEVASNSIRDSGLNKAFLRSIEKSHRDTIIEHLRSGKRVFQVSIALSKYCFYKGMDPLLLLKNLSAGGDILFIISSTEHLPSLDELNPFMLYLDDIWLILSTEQNCEFINDVCEFALAIGDITAHSITGDDVNAAIPANLPANLIDADHIESTNRISREDDWGMEGNGINMPESAADSSGLKNIFFEFMEESNSYLAEIESSILLLEKKKDDLNIVNEIFRPFHTIKGNCGYLGFKEIGRVCHSIETLLDGVRNSTIPVNQNIIDILLETVDAVKRLRLSLPMSVKDRFGLTDAELGQYLQYDVIDARPLIQKIDTLLNLSSTIKDQKSPPRIGEILLATGDITEDQLNRALKLQERRLGEILVDEGIVPEDKVKTALEIQEYQKTNVKAPAGAIKVDTEKVDSLVNLVGELVITQTLIRENPSIAQFAGQGIQKDISHLGKITREIQDQVMSMRMLPLKQTFQKMMRVVRDVAKKAGKNVDLIISGEDTELDKTVIEEISDPLVHILRNAVDHGIESPEKRSQKGKPEKGGIYLSAFHRGGSIVIEIKDDGQGLCKEKILRKAVEKGLLEDAVEITDQQIYHLIFQAGFSTAEKVTDISGRGVGMDVVRRNIEKLRGRIDIQSKEGSGTSISITLPLTLAIIDGMVVQVGCEKYIIPTLSIEESYRPKHEEIITVQEKGEICNLRGSLLPLIRLSELYKIEPRYKKPSEALLVVVESDGMRASIMVDELVGQQQVVIKTLGDTFKNIKGIAGGTILGDGKVGLILDVRGLIESALF
ncbi:MAG TPA: hypothetical protein DDX84_10705 [Nitrospiraceae bacterium]|nr:hypothetical protein [Nitrospiraceae bacterium]